MKRVLIVLATILTISNLNGNPFDKTLAQVELTKTHLVKLSYVEEMITKAETINKRELTVSEKEQLLSGIIDKVIIDQAIERAGISITEEMVLNMYKKQLGETATDQQIKDYLTAQHRKPYSEIIVLLIEQLTNQEFIKLAGAEDIKKLNLGVTEEEILAAYNENKTKFVNPDYVRVNHIFFATRNKTPEEIEAAKKSAEAALLQIKQGEKSFDELVQTVSEDKRAALNGGELGFISRDEANTVALLGNNFISEVFNLSMDQVHGVVESTAGFHIVKITEKRSARLLNIGDRVKPDSPVTVAQYIQQSLLQQKSASAFMQVTETVMERLRTEAKIDIKEKSIPWK